MSSERNTSIDLLRGLVMVIMALDHARDFFTSFDSDPTDLATTTIPLFLTRFVTHYCAPVFVMLAGTSAYLSMARGKPASEMSRFLVTRGLWLIVLEMTVVRWGWLFDVTYRFSVLQVIWAIGWSMIVLAVLIRLPIRWVLTFGAVTVLFHDLFDSVHVASLGKWGTAWALVHEAKWDWEPISGHRVAIAYPLVPWIGVMALGYAMGPLVLRPLEERRRTFAWIGLFAIVAFLALRGWNRYGDPHPWSVQAKPGFTMLLFLNCAKYPPSLCYLLMTLGPAFVLLAAFEKARGAIARIFIVFGRVPLFYYVLHLPLLHAIAWMFFLRRDGHVPVSPDSALRFSLPGVYAVWLAAVVLLYPACRWFAGVKARNKSVWLSYL